METEGVKSPIKSNVVDYLGFDRDDLKEITKIIFTKKKKAPEPLIPTFPVFEKKAKLEEISEEDIGDVYEEFSVYLYNSYWLSFERLKKLMRSEVIL